MTGRGPWRGHRSSRAWAGRRPPRLAPCPACSGSGATSAWATTPPC
ncbi:hypothetical protein [Ornithinimicrobium kibberense]